MRLESTEDPLGRGLLRLLFLEARLQPVGEVDELAEPLVVREERVIGAGEGPLEDAELQLVHVGDQSLKYDRVALI